MQNPHCLFCIVFNILQRVWLAGLHKLWQPGSLAARKWRENEEIRRKWRENVEMERDWLSTFPHSLFISYIKICHILMQNANYGTFVANITKIITYALWGNTSGSDLLRGSSASCAGLTKGGSAFDEDHDNLNNGSRHAWYLIDGLSI